MHILLLIVYGSLACYGIWKIPFLKNSGIRPGWLLLLFALHVLAGWAHNRIAWRYFPEHGDIWNYFSLSFLYRHRLLSEFNLFLSDNSTWTYITHNGIVFLQMLLDLLSGDDMDINTLLFAFPVFLGNVALFRVFRRRFPDDTLAASTVFWLPSVLFWTSCIYREGMLFMLLGFLFYHLDYLSTQPVTPDRPTRHPLRSSRRLFYVIALFLLIAYFRLAVAIVLIPALLVWLQIDHPLPRPWRRTPRRTLAVALIVLTTLTLSIPAIREPLLRAVTTEQAAFQKLDGHSRLPLPVIDGTFSSVWRTLPTAALNGFFEPLPGSGGQPVYLAFSVELILVWLMVLVATARLILLHRYKSDLSMQIKISAETIPPSSALPAAASPSSAFPVACLLFALTGMLTIGFIVPFAGTIVRYRSIYLPFLLAPALHSLHSLPPISRLNRWLTNKLRFLI